MSTGLIALETLMVGFFNSALTIQSTTAADDYCNTALCLMVNLVGITLNITGAKIPGFASKVKIKFM